MQSFIKSVLLNLQKNETDFSNCVFILPNKRSGYYLKKELSSLISKTIFSPRIVSIEKFIEELSGQKILSNTELTFEFYKVYLSNTPIEKQESFEEFIKWSRTLIQDFNQIDKEIIDPKQVFDYLKAVKEMDHWSMDASPSNLVKRHLYFWKNIKLYHREFTKYLSTINAGYQGILEKSALSKSSNYIDINSSLKYIFIGFNALNKIESLIIQKFLKAEIAEIYWDIDKISINSSFNNSAFFINQYRSNWPYYKSKEINWINNNYSSKKNIHAIGVSKNIGQAKYIGQILKQNIHQNGKTAIVLGDENLLIPVLNSLPLEIEDVNITMGFPLFSSSVSSIFYKIFKIQLNESNKYYYKDVISILSHELIRPLFQKENLNYCDNIINYINKNNSLYIDLNYLISKVKEKDYIINTLFKKWSNNPKLAIKICKELVVIIRDNYLINTENKLLTVEHLYRFNKIFNELESLINKFKFINSTKILFDLLQDIIKNERLKFNSESFSKIQIMGLLESRVLDFENIIISSMNEGILPSGNSENSFIPFDVKIDNNIPTYKEQDAIYSYHFYRLIQRAKNVYLLYNTEPDVLNGGEKSRFIRQIEFEGIHKVNHIIANSNTPKVDNKLIEITKTKEIIDDLNLLVMKGISTSALLSYIRDPIDFYYKKILNIKEEQTVEETIESNTLGTVIHESLKQIYKPLENKVLCSKYLKKELKKLDNTVKKQFELNYINGQFNTGKNLIILEVAKKYISVFIESEIESINNGNNIKIISIENDYNKEIKISKFKNKIILKGQIDRIDMFNGVLRIIDYKTGKRIEKRELNLSNWDIQEYEYDKIKNWFQLLFYSYIYYNDDKLQIPLEAGIVSFKNLKSGLLKFNYGTRSCNTTIIDNQILKEFENILEKILLEIIDIEQNFKEKKISKKKFYA